MRPPSPVHAQRWHQRLAASAMYLLSGLGILAVLLTATIKRHLTFEGIMTWAANNGSLLSWLLWLFLFAGFGVHALFWPNIPIRWVKNTYPRVSEEDTFTVLTTRLIGAGFLIIVFSILARL
jgi:hypothetical protein